MRQLVRRGAYPALLGGAVLASERMLHHDVAELAAATVPSLVVAAILLLLQRLLAYNEAWRGWKQDLGLDVAYLLFSSWLVPGLFRIFGFGLLLLGSLHIAQAWGAPLWPGHWPVLLQLPLALVLGELGNYGMHRWMHTSALGWRIHAIHHSSERLYLLSSARGHPLNVLLIYTSTVGPVVLLGAGPELLVLMTAFTSVNGALQHSNVDFDLRGLNWLVASTDLHRVHHSTIPSEGNGNYGGNLIVWDIVFGTRFLHDDPAHQVQVGITDLQFPKGFGEQLLLPFFWNRLARPR